MKSEGQLALKLLAFKNEVLKKKSATWAITAKVCASMIGLGSRQPGVKSFSKFDGQQLCSPLTYRLQILSIKDQLPFKSLSKLQEARSILRLGFALSSDLIYIGLI